MHFTAGARPPRGPIELLSGSHLCQSTLERLDGLASLDQVLVVEDNSRNGVDPIAQIKLLASPNVRGIFIRCQYGAGAVCIEPHACSDFNQYIRRRSGRGRP